MRTFVYIYIRFRCGFVSHAYHLCTQCSSRRTLIINATPNTIQYYNDKYVVIEKKNRKRSFATQILRHSIIIWCLTLTTASRNDLPTVSLFGGVAKSRLKRWTPPPSQCLVNESTDVEFKKNVLITHLNTRAINRTKDRTKIVLTPKVFMVKRVVIFHFHAFSTVYCCCVIILFVVQNKALLLYLHLLNQIIN